MRIAITDLRDALAATSAAIAGRPQIPLLAGVRITQTGAEASFRATDWTTWITSRCPVIAGAEDLDVIVSHRVLTSIAKATRSATVEITLVGNEVCITAGSSDWKSRMFIGDMPDSPSAPGKVGAVDAAVLRAAVRDVAQAASTEPGTPNLQPVQVSAVSRSTLNLIATDRYRIHSADIEWAGATDNLQAFPDASALEKAVKDLSGNIELHAEQGHPMFGLQDARTTVLIRNIDSNPPPPKVSRYSAGEPASRTTIASDDLIDALNAVQAVSGTADAVTVTVTAEAFSVAGSSDDGSGGHQFAVEQHEGRGLVALFNGTFLAEAVRALGSKVVHIGWVAPARPAILTADDSDRHCVLMPVRQPDSRWL